MEHDVEGIRDGMGKDSHPIPSSDIQGKKTGKKLEDFPTHMFYLCRLRLKDDSSAVVVVVVVGCYSPSHRSMGKWMDGGASPDKDIFHTA